VQLDNQELKVQQVRKAILERQVHKELPDCKELKDHRGRKVIKALPGQLVRLEVLDYLACKEL
jgi:hypothetical protein